ncbi:MAG: phosphorylase [Clostridia bacterium]|nr:phosphorylase [Clostridia bacterium]MDD4376037.1 phosphorylase [Clostridia bacterium]
MEYNKLLEAHKRYGTTTEDIIKYKDYTNILDTVVIAPWWEHSMFENDDVEIKQEGTRIYNIRGDKFEFSFIQLKLIGAPSIMDYILSLGVTKCKNIIFLGSAGSLDEDIKIGDLVVPTYSICGDGASRYLNDNLEDEFGKKEYPNMELTELLKLKTKKVTEIYKVGIYNEANFSVDSIFAQFAHMDYIKNTGAKIIEMETALVFKCANICNIKSTALLCISDNTLVKKSLYSGRSDEENQYRHMVRNSIIPKIIIEVVKDIQK